MRNEEREGERTAEGRDGAEDASVLDALRLPRVFRAHARHLAVVRPVVRAREELG